MSSLWRPADRPAEMRHEDQLLEQSTDELNAQYQEVNKRLPLAMLSRGPARRCDAAFYRLIIGTTYHDDARRAVRHPPC